MSRFAKFAAVTAITLASAGMVVACGDDDGGDGASSPAPAGNGTPVKPADGNSMKKQKNPASAGTKRPKAPDDVISDRPGGPKDKKNRKKRGKQKGGVSGGLSANPPAVSPVVP